jgi:hypothetical protein
MAEPLLLGGIDAVTGAEKHWWVRTPMRTEKISPALPD